MTEVESKKTPKKNPAIFLIIFVIITVIIVLIAFPEVLAIFTPMDQETKDKIAIFEALKEEVMKSLKSPSSAKFPNPITDKGVYIMLMGTGYQISAWVDAQNTFGVYIRNSIIAWAEKDGSRFKITQCEIF